MKSGRPGPRFGLPFLEGAYEAEVDEELAFHLEMRTQKLIGQGMSPAEAREEAERRFGNRGAIRTGMIRDGKREAVMRDWLESVGDGMRDVRMAVRSLLRTPGLTLASLLILAIGIGATSSFFAVVHAVAFAPMPFGAPERVVQIEVKAGPDGDPSSILSPGVLLTWQDGAAGVEAVAPMASVTASLSANDVPIRVLGFAVSASYWEILGVSPTLGRTFSLEDDRPSSARVIVLSHGLWERVFAADPSVLGRSLELDGVATTVIGVMPEPLDVLEGDAEFWRPLRLDPGQRANIGTRYLAGMALLRPGASADEAERGLDAVLRQLDLRTDDGAWFETVLTPTEELLSRPLRPILYVTLGAMALVLLVGCGNVATLLIARGASREQEFAIRAALGAGRSRIVRGLLVEGVVLAGAASLAGLALAQWGVMLLRARTPFPVPRLQEAALNPTVLFFTAGLALVTALVFGLAPALRGSRVDIQGAIASGEGAGGRSTAGRDRARSGFLALQVALSLTLLVGAGLLVRTSLELRSVPNGYQSEGVLSGLVALPFARYPDLPSVLERYDEIYTALNELPNVEQAAIGSRVPMTGAGAGYDFVLDGGEETRALQTRLRITGPGYFSTLGITLAAGRELTAADDASAPPSVVVNQSFVRGLGMGEAEAVGRTVSAAGGTVFTDEAGRQIAWEIVGVVEDARDLGPRGGARPELFFAMEQAPSDPWNWLGRQMVLTLRTEGDPTALIVPLQRAIRNLDPALPVYDVRTMRERLDTELARERFVAMIVSGLGAIGLLLAATGIFGTVAYRVSQRTREIGVRVALGADTGGVTRLIVGQSLVPVGFGLAFGLPLTWLVGRGLEILLYGVAPGDLATTLGAVLLLLGVSALAALIPARRATSIDPVEALRGE